jgi:hypothetical protein
MTCRINFLIFGHISVFQSILNSKSILKAESDCYAFHKVIFFLWRCGPTLAMASSFARYLDPAPRHTTFGRTPLDEWSARRRDLYLTTHNTQNGQTSVPPVWFEPTIPAGERPQTYALDRAATGTGQGDIYIDIFSEFLSYNVQISGFLSLIKTSAVKIRGINGLA